MLYDTRMGLIGRDVLTQSSGSVSTTFEDGTLPKAMQMACILLCDGMDFIRPDVAYVRREMVCFCADIKVATSELLWCAVVLEQRAFRRIWRL